MAQPQPSCGNRRVMSSFIPGRNVGIRPLLVLGLAGFPAPLAQAWREQVAIATTGAVQWRVGTIAEADAWLVDGSRTRRLEGGDWQVEAPGAPPLRFDPAALGKPVALALPVPDVEIDHRITFDPADPASLLLVLANFAQQLRSRAMLLHLAGLLAHRHARLKKSRGYRVTGGAGLIAVLDVDGDAGVHPEATVAQFEKAVWEPCAGGDIAIPDAFARGRTRQLLWEYAGRAQRELLPARYKSTAILLRDAPLLPQRLFNDAQLFVLREMKKSPRTYRQLCAGAPVAPADISRALSSLYIVGAIRSAEEEARAG